MDLVFELVKENGAQSLKSVIEDSGAALDSESAREFLRGAGNLAFAAKLGGEVVGLAYGYVLTRLDGKGPQFHIYSVDVHSGHRNKGIGSGLVRFVADYARENGFSECFVITEKSNGSACRVYEKAGGKSEFEDEIVYVMDFEKEEFQ